MTPTAKYKTTTMQGVYQEPAQNRVDDTDKAILDLKGRMRKVKTWIDKLENQEKEATDKCKELVQAGQK